MTLTKSQESAVTCPLGPAMILAGPGSGKTLVIAHRIQYLISHEHIRPEEILVLTFSRAAARQMERRFFALSERKSSGIWFGTFHSVFFQILRSACRFPPGCVLLEQEKRALAGSLAERFGAGSREDTDLAAQIISEISRVKNRQISLETYSAASCQDAQFRQIFQSYQETLRKNQKLDFDDMLVRCRDLLRERTEFLLSWQKRCRCVLVDEFQDINPLQYDIVRMLAMPENHLFVVGDDDQSIYRFRGSGPEIMLEFPRDYPMARSAELTENFRCGRSIVRAAGMVIRENSRRFEKHLTSCARQKDKVEIRIFPGRKEQAEELAGRIRKSIEEGRRPSEIAILTRTNTGGRYLAERLAAESIPVCIRGYVPLLYDHWICADICAYLRLAGGEAMKRGDFLKVANRPLRYLSRECLDEETVSFEKLKVFYRDMPWMRERVEELEMHLKNLRTMRPYAAVNYIRLGIGYQEFVEEHAKSRRMVPEELTAVLMELQEESRCFGSSKEWFSHMDKRRQEEQDRRAGSEGPEEAVTLSTLHTSKGLEYDEVFLPDCSAGILPHRKALQAEEIEEERRLLYVGMTRARERLHIYAAGEPSPFLAPLLEAGDFANPVPIHSPVEMTRHRPA